jgi:myo-inositol catabolism protein IolC
MDNKYKSMILKQFKENKISREDAVKKIAQTYSNLCKLWLQSRD